MAYQFITVLLTDVNVLLKPQRFETQIDAVSQLFHFLYTT